ncbi:MAG TPA: SDR family oxidoreductase [Clostridia bacterium]|nr:SDR family oxidoreductase [Clostridia bacterium]
MMGLQGKVAIVTGAARGIGRAVAIRLAAEGVSVVACDLDPRAPWLKTDDFIKEPQSVMSVVDEIRSGGGNAVGIYADITVEGEVNDVITLALKEFGRVDILSNNAGVALTKLVHETTLEDWERVIRVNATGTFITCRAVARLFMDQRSGSIINTASIAGKTGTPSFGAYCASKAAVILLTNVLAKELAPFNARANCICPGMVKTDMWKKLNQEMGKYLQLKPGQTPMEKLLEATPISKPEEPEDIAGLVAFLASDDAYFITGQAINIDGGYESH